LGDKLVLTIVKALNQSELNTILSGYSSLALSAYAQTNQPLNNNANFSIAALFLDNKEKTFNSDSKVSLDEQVKKIIFKNPDQQRLFYQLTQAGFDKELPKKASNQGIEIYREYRNKQGDSIKETTLGAEIEVHIQVRALDNSYLTNIAIVDLLPGGFEVVRDSVRSEQVEYADLREDRVVFFTSLGSHTQELVYRIKAINTGKYTVPPILAESMYNPSLHSNGAVSSMTVTAD
jgi:uncharacterized protein YfaS (alpha-2-macroglobulin family)